MSSVPVPESGQPAISVISRRLGLTGIPREVDGIPVNVKFIGRFIAYSDPRDRFDRPVPIGVSSGHLDITAGTIGELFDFGRIIFYLGYNTMDAAIASTTVNALDRSTPPDGYGIPGSTLYGDRDANCTDETSRKEALFVDQI